MDKQEVSIEEKVKAVFEWAGFKIDSLAGTMAWFTPDMYVVNSKQGFGKLPIPDDIEFLGYMDKYLFKKLQDDGYLITLEAKPNEHEYNAELHNVDRGGVKYSVYQESAGIALLNAIYEVIDVHK